MDWSVALVLCSPLSHKVEFPCKCKIAVLHAIDMNAAEYCDT